MDSVGVNVIETAALGRPFQLGMLYDCRKDALVPGITLWDKEQLQHNVNICPKINTNFKVTASDSIEEKVDLLQVDGSLKLSLLSGLINVSGAAKYLNDTKKSFKQQRLTLHYHSTTRFEVLTINHLATENTAYREVFDNDTATHIVTGVLYGADACFVFDREVLIDEDMKTVEGDLQAVFDKLKGVISFGANIDLSLNSDQKTALQKFSCTFHGDFQLNSNPASFEEALKVFADLPKLLGDNKELAVPLRVWLYPLDKLYSKSAKLQNDISISLIRNVESVIESLSITEMKCSDLLKDTPSLAFKAFHDKILQMKQNCHDYKSDLKKNLSDILPKIRGNMKEEAALHDLLNDHEKSPFRGSDLEQWVGVKEEESDIIKRLLKQLNDSGAQVVVNINEILMDLKVETLVSYTLTSLEWTDVLLCKQKAYLCPLKGENDENTCVLKQKSWLTSDIIKTMKCNLKTFIELMNSNNCKPDKFIVESKEMKNNPGSCILLYKNSGSDEAIKFIPPAKPACPNPEQITGDRVVLNVSQPCLHTVELKLLYRMKEEEDWKSQPVPQSRNTVTLTDLSSDTEYEIKCVAVGNLNYTVDSDVIHLRVIDKKLIKAAESIINNLNLTESNCNKLLEESRAPLLTAVHKKIQDMKQYCQTYREDLKDKIKSLINSVQTCEREACSLTNLLKGHEESPFEESLLTEWITIKEKELNTVNKFLQQLQESGAEVNNSLDVLLSDINVENLVCYTFSSLKLPDALLSEQENYLKPQTMRRNPEKTPNASSQTWLTEGIREQMKVQLKILKELMILHGNHFTKFVVSSKDHRSHPGSCILLYEKGGDEAINFIPPTKPACPNPEQITGDRVVLKVSQPCLHTVELKLLYRMKKEEDWKSQPVPQSQNTVTLTDLSPDTEYEIKCAAVGKLNYTVDSDVIRVTSHAINIGKERTRNIPVNDRLLPQNLSAYFSLFTGKQLPVYNDIKKKLHEQDLKEVFTIRNCGIFVVFIVVVSQAKNDIEAALRLLDEQQVTKPSILMLLHHTFNEEKLLPDSSEYVKRKDTLTVDCLFYEDSGLLKCQRNNYAMEKVTKWIKTLEQGGRRNPPLQSTRQQSSVKEPTSQTPQHYLPQPQEQPGPRSNNNVGFKGQTGNFMQQDMHKINYYTKVTGVTHSSHEQFMKSLLQQTPGLRNVSAVEKCDVIFHFCAVSSETDWHAALRDCQKWRDKPVVVIILHNTYDLETIKFPDSHRFVNSLNSITVECVFFEDLGLLKHQINENALLTVSNWLNNKIYRDHQITP